MKYILLICCSIAALVLGAGSLMVSPDQFKVSVSAPTISEVKIAEKEAQVAPKEPSPQASAPAVMGSIVRKKIDVITLGSKNLITLRGVIVDESVGKIQEKAMNMSSNLKDDDTIYMVIDSPGGSVLDGKMMIDTLAALPQEVKTITIFSASMAFQTVQNMGERLITPSGTLMSHRAKLQGVGGEIGSDGKGEMLTQINWIMKQLQELDMIAASRMSMELKPYQELIADEYWVTGSNAVAEKAADRVVLVRCAKELLDGRDMLDIRTFFGTVHLEFSQCPLLQAPVKVDMGGIAKEKRAETANWIHMMLNDKREFVRKYVVTNRLEQLVK